MDGRRYVLRSTTGNRMYLRATRTPWGWVLGWHSLPRGCATWRSIPALLSWVTKCQPNIDWSRMTIEAIDPVPQPTYKMVEL